MVIDVRGRRSPVSFAASEVEKVDLFLGFRHGAYAHMETWLKIEIAIT